MSYQKSKTIGLTPKNLWLPQLVLDKIKHYTIDGHLGAGQQYDLFIKEFPQYYIKKKFCIMQLTSFMVHEFMIS